MPNNKLTRIEVIDWTTASRFGEARVFTHRDDSSSLIPQLQDNGKTLKVFIVDSEEATRRLSISKEEHDAKGKCSNPFCQYCGKGNDDK